MGVGTVLGAPRTRTLDRDETKTGHGVAAASAPKPGVSSSVQREISDHVASNVSASSAAKAPANQPVEAPGDGPLSPSDAPAGASVTETIGPYRIVRLLGAGGMGEVFLAYDDRLDRQVAIKRLHTRGSASDRRRERFRREARVAARINHPAIVHVYDLVRDGEFECLVMEYVEGTTLSQRLTQSPMELAAVVELARQIAEGMAAAHDAGVIHRDLKSENILLDPHGHAKIADFGIAKLVDADSLTMGNAVIGTLRAMSPEQGLGREVDRRTDLFSFGSLLYETLTGRPPFDSDNALATLQQLITEPHTPVTEVVDGVPKSLSALIDLLLEKDRVRRPRDFHAVVRALTGIGESLAYDRHTARTRSPRHSAAADSSSSSQLAGRKEARRRGAERVEPDGSASPRDDAVSAPAFRGQPTDLIAAVSGRANERLAPSSDSSEVTNETITETGEGLPLSDWDERTYALASSLRQGEALANLRQSRAVAEARGDEGEQVALLLNEAELLDWCSQWKPAANAAEMALSRVRRIDSDSLLAAIHFACGRAHLRREQFADAVELLTSAVQRARAAGDHELLIKALLCLAPTLVHTGQMGQALEWFDELERRCREADDTFHLTMVDIRRRDLRLERNHIELAIEELQSARLMARQLGDAQLERLAALELAEALYWYGWHDEALAVAERARQLYLHLMYEFPSYEDHLLLARIHCSRGRDDKARDCLAWLDDHCAVTSYTPSSRALVAMVRRGVSMLEDGVYKHDSWLTVERRLRAHPGRTLHIECMVMASELLVHTEHFLEARVWADRALQLAGDSKLWQPRLTAVTELLVRARAESE